MDKVEDLIEKIRPLAEKIYIATVTTEKELDFACIPYDSWLAAEKFYEGEKEFKEAKEEKEDA